MDYHKIMSSWHRSTQAKVGSQQKKRFIGQIMMEQFVIKSRIIQTMHTDFQAHCINTLCHGVNHKHVYHSGCQNTARQGQPLSAPYMFGVWTEPCQVPRVT